MQEIPLSPIPSQTLQIVLAGQNVQISVNSKNGYDFTDDTLSTQLQVIFFDLTVNGVSITVGQNCLNLKRLLLNRQYLGVIGDFMFVDTQGVSDPEYAGLGSRWLLLYLEATDL